MKLYGWAAAVIFLLVIASVNDAIREWAVWGIGVIALILIAVAVEKAFAVPATPEPHRNGALDRLARHDQARWAAVAPAFEPVGEDRTP